MKQLNIVYIPTEKIAIIIILCPQNDESNNSNYLFLYHFWTLFYFFVFKNCSLQAIITNNAFWFLIEIVPALKLNPNSTLSYFLFSYFQIVFHILKYFILIIINYHIVILPLSQL